jgi:hypothetical protein
MIAITLGERQEAADFVIRAAAAEGEQAAGHEQGGNDRDYGFE